MKKAAEEYKKTISSQFLPKKKTITEEQVRKAIGSIRKLKRVSGDGPVTFEWPTSEQILDMPRDKPFQFDSFRW